MILFQDGIGSRGPDEGAMGAIVVLHKGVDLVHQILHAAEGAAANGPLAEQGKPALHLIQRRRVRRRVVNVIAGPTEVPATVTLLASRLLLSVAQASGLTAWPHKKGPRRGASPLF